MEEKIEALIKAYEKELADWNRREKEMYLDCCESSAMNQQINAIEDFLRDLRALKEV